VGEWKNNHLGSQNIPENSHQKSKEFINHHNGTPNQKKSSKKYAIRMPVKKSCFMVSPESVTNFHA